MGRVKDLSHCGVYCRETSMRFASRSDMAAAVTRLGSYLLARSATRPYLIVTDEASA